MRAMAFALAVAAACFGSAASASPQCFVAGLVPVLRSATASGDLILSGDDAETFLDEVNRIPPETDTKADYVILVDRDDAFGLAMVRTLNDSEDRALVCAVSVDPQNVFGELIRRWIGRRA